LTNRLRDSADHRAAQHHVEVSLMLIGLLLGIVIGLVIGPLIRSWLSWREYVEASQEARLHEEVLRLMSESPQVDGNSGDRSFRPDEQR
jgi:hypothetical protein